MEQITKQFLDELQTKNPAALQNAKDPDFQYSLYAIQKEYARSGDKDQGDILVDLLVDRVKETGRTLKQIVLNESIQTVPKLQKAQLDTLTLIFLVRYVSINNILDVETFHERIYNILAPFVPSLLKNRVCYQHIAYSGSGIVVDISSTSLERIFGFSYPSFFTKGFDKNQVSGLLKQLPEGEPLFIPCFRNPQLLQLAPLQEPIIHEFAKHFGIPDDVTKQVIAMRRVNPMNDTEVKADLLSMGPLMAHMFDVWDNSSLKSTNLTSVGMAIAHANFRRVTKDTSDLAIWINEKTS